MDGQTPDQPRGFKLSKLVIGQTTYNYHDARPCSVTKGCWQQQYVYQNTTLGEQKIGNDCTQSQAMP